MNSLSLVLTVLPVVLSKGVLREIQMSADKLSPRDGDTVTISFDAKPACNLITWMNSATDNPFSTCMESTCSSHGTWRYNFTIDSNTSTVKINTFNWSEDAFVWKVQCGNETAIFSFSKPNGNRGGGGSVIPGVIGGIVAGVLIVVGLLVVTLLCCCCNRQRTEINLKSKKRSSVTKHRRIHCPTTWDN